MDENTNTTAPTPVEETNTTAPVEQVAATPEVLSETPATPETAPTPETPTTNPESRPLTPEEKKWIEESGINDGGVNFETPHDLADASHLDGLKSCSRCGRDESPAVKLTVVGDEKLCADHL